MEIQWADSLISICMLSPKKTGALESATAVTHSRLPTGHCVPLGEILHLSEHQASYPKKVRKIPNAWERLVAEEGIVWGRDITEHLPCS